MNSHIQSAAIDAVNSFLNHTFDVETLELTISKLWVANNRDLDGPLGDIYPVVTDWDHKYSLRQLVVNLRELAASPWGAS